MIVCWVLAEWEKFIRRTTHTVTGYVALKLLPEGFADDQEYLKRFQRESHVAARLREPHVIPIHDFGEIDGQLFIDMRLVDGADMGALLDDATGRIEPQRAVHLISQVAQALDAAHADDLVHRDIKPSNILVTLERLRLRGRLRHSPVDRRLGRRR